jgi:uncharacterized protein (DUF169 family)
MKTLQEKAKWLFEKLSFAYQPIGLMMADKIPTGAVSLKKKGSGCIATLIFSAAKGKTVAIDKDSTGYSCSAFFLGYSDWIFKGVEYFLAHSPIPIGRECERFVQKPKQAKEFVRQFVPEQHEERAYVFKPFASFAAGEEPEVVIFFANPDQMSALVYLVHYAHPLDSDRIRTDFASACMGMATIPLRYARKGEDKALWGLHDIAIRPTLPAELTTLAMPLPMFRELCNLAPKSFLITDHWKKIQERIKGRVVVSGLGNAVEEVD